MTKPTDRPARPEFSTGPTAKRPGWSLEALADAPVGRSHRSKACRPKLLEVIERSRALLGLPDDYRLAIVPASDTGAIELAMWSLLGARGVDMLAWESFGQAWQTDVSKQLKLEDVRNLSAPYGAIPDLGAVSPERDVVFTWNGTTSGVKVPDGAWIAEDRAGLTLCDATSAVFAMDIPCEKLDVITWSWQKALGGEGAHGMLALSPRAVERLETVPAGRPLPKIFRLTKGGALIEGIFKGATINTPSMLAVEDALDALKWAESIGGLPALQARSARNLAVIDAWVAKTPWAEFLAADPATRSSTSVCLKIAESAMAGLDEAAAAALPDRIADLLEAEGVAFDINNHRDAPPGLRIWGGPTVEAEDIAALLPWLDWAFETVRAESAKAA